MPTNADHSNEPIMLQVDLDGESVQFRAFEVVGTEAISLGYELRVDFDPGELGRELFSRMLGSRATVVISPDIAVHEPAGDGDDLSVVYQLDPRAPRRTIARRRIHGLLVALDRGVGGGVYHAVVASPLAMLALSGSIRIHAQDAAPVDVVKGLLASHGITIEPSHERLRQEYQKRDFCVQYRETDLNFVQRLLEEEGIAHHFEHGAEEPKLILTDHPDAFSRLCVQSNLPLDGTMALAHRSETGFGLTEHLQLTPGKILLGDRNPRRPLHELRGEAAGEGFAEAGEMYDFFGRFGEDQRAQRLARTRKEALDVDKHLVSLQSNCVRLVPGRVVTLGHSPIEYLVTRVAHTARAYEGIEYVNTVTLFPLAGSDHEKRRPFRPACLHPSPVVRGLHTATVVSRSGDDSLATERVDMDTGGRIRVRFHWDREKKASYWVRVARAWAGRGYGVFFAPRIGHEVTVAFLEGDPDHPIVIGSVHNEISVPPTQNPLVSVIRSSSAGGTFNEILFDDAAGAEQLKIQGGGGVVVGAKQKIVIAADEIELRANKISTNQDIVTAELGQSHGVER